MSAPISSFSKLSLSQTMHSSRGHRHGPHGGKGKQVVPPDDNHSSENESDNDPDPDDGPGHEDPDLEPEHALALYHCRHIGTEDDRRYAFQIADAEIIRYGVRIKSSGGLQCSCEPPEGGGTCRHIRWLLAQLGHAGLSVVTGAAPDYYGQIAAVGVENICEELHWELREGTESDEEETTWQLKKLYRASTHGLQTRGMIRERLKDIRDILATLSTESPVDYRKDIFESPDDITIEDVLVPHDLGATVSRLLVHDDNVFYQFKSLVPHNIRAADYFRKMDLKARQTCQLLDDYVETGSTAAGQHDLIWASQELVNIVNFISTNVTERQPLSSSSRREAAKALVSILVEVVRNRNKDVYQDDKLPRRRQHGEPHTDRNLYQRLIGSTSPQNPTGNAFIIKALQDLPEAQHFVEDLEEVLGILNEIGWGPAPMPYRERLVALITQLKGGVGPSASSSSGKRPASGMDRKGVKRMK